MVNIYYIKVVEYLNMKFIVYLTNYLFGRQNPVDRENVYKSAR